MYILVGNFTVKTFIDRCLIIWSAPLLVLSDALEYSFTYDLRLHLIKIAKNNVISLDYNPVEFDE